MTIVVLSDYSPHRFLQNDKSGQIPHPGLPQNLIVKNLTRDYGDEVHLVNISNDVKKDSVFIEENVHYHFLKCTPNAVRLLSLEHSDLIKLHFYLNKLNPDILYIIGHNKYSYYGVFSNRKSVVCNTGYWKDHFMYSRKEFNPYWALSFYYEKATIRACRFMQFVSPHVEKEYSNISKLDKYWVIEPPVDDEFLRPLELEWSNDLLYVGSIIERKNLLDILKVVKNISNVRIKIISMTNSGYYYNKVKEFINENNFNERVIFLGYRDARGIINELQKCLCLILLSAWESNGMVYAEAMATGKPVIGSNRAAIPFTIKDGITGFIVEYGNQSQLEVKLLELVNCKERAVSIGQNGRNEALQRWDSRIITLQVRKMFEEILKP